MRKRHHTNQSKYQFSLNGSISNRSLRSSLKRGSRGVYGELASDDTLEDKLAKVESGGVAPLEKWDKTEGYEIKLVDEISENELKEFAFSCIESLASLAQPGKLSIGQMLARLAHEKLTSFTELARESQEAKLQFKEYVTWSKQFISSVQPLLSASVAPAQEVSQLRAQVMQCAERSMSQKYRSQTLAKRVDFLVESVAIYVASTGMAMGFPAAVMGKVLVAVRGALLVVTK